MGSIGIETVEDLLHYYPRRHLDRTTLTPVSKLKKGGLVTIVGKVEACGMREARRRKFFQAILTDGTGLLTLIWFNGTKYIQQAIKTGDRLAVNGKVDFYNGFQIVHPEYDKLKQDEDPLNTGAIIPLYPQPQELKKVRLDSRAIRRIVRNVCESLEIIPDHYPQEILQTHELVSLDEALRNIHFADSEDDLFKAVKRLKFDEHFFLQLLMALRKDSIQRVGTKALDKIGPQVKLISDNLPFALTEAQKRVLKEIRNDMAQPYSMNRLLQGDVGSGKTIIAVLSAAIAVANHVQVAVMAPTEILAHQHFESFKKHADISKMACAILVGGTPKKERDGILSALKEGRIDIIVGTHALIQKDVFFKKLGLSIVDEQHRFGVVQRGDLMLKGYNPHFLAMTATPIPRTLAITYHGDMDLSIIDEMPKDRKKVMTKVVNPERLQNVYAFIQEEVQAGRNCMVVYPLVEESEKSDLAAAVEAHKNLSENIFPEFNVGLIHGRMKKEEKDAIMDAYARNEIHILVSTTVIEVGIDIPNATVMLIEHADRFGLTQLHQLRGRVGRGSEKSYCILVRRKYTEPSRKRLAIMESTTDGFKISDEDLKMRGPGEFYGIRQSGFLRYKIADLVMDGPLIREARKAAINIVDKDPKLQDLAHEKMRTRFLKGYAQHMETVNIG